MASLPGLSYGQVYSWRELNALLDRVEDYEWRRGMVSLPSFDALVLITHFETARQFDYHDFWDGPELIYGGQGQVGDQQLIGENRYVSENARLLWVFQGAGPHKLRYLGCPTCVDTQWAVGPDKNNDLRRILRFRLHFPSGLEVSPVSIAVGAAKHFGGGESDAHRELKKYVAAHPQLIGLPAASVADVEHSFKSPDRADIVFALPDGSFVAVEIEVAGEHATLVGAWQAAKYRTLLCLEHDLELASPRVSACLVANSIGSSARAFCSRYGIAAYDVTCPT